MTNMAGNAERRAWHLSGMGIVLCVSLLASTPAATRAGELQVEVKGLRNNDGLVRLALYDRPELFPISGKAFVISDVPIPYQGLSLLFSDLPLGEYALALFHDEDGDNVFDKGFLGLPLEGFGFSNDATVFFSAPSFSAAAVTVGEALTTITVHVRYWSQDSSKERREDGEP